MARVLLIEDELKIARFVARALAANGYHSEVAGDGPSGLEMLTSECYDLVVLDLRLPGMDGLTVLERAMAANPRQPVLVLSALTDVESKVRCFELGAVDYLGKPFALPELLARIRSRLRAALPAVPDAERLIIAGGIVLDSQRRVADSGNGPVALSTREYLLLGYLMRHADQPCDRSLLLSEVWGYSFDPGTNVVDVYIARLRAKLGSGVIETVRNVGYAIRAA